MPVYLSGALYPILWWAIILFLDGVNFRRNRKSLIFGNPAGFFGVILPASVLYWLYFELANFYFPQWRYLGILETLPARTVMAFASFGTVTPIVMEIIWLLNGPIAAEKYIRREFNFKPVSILLFFIGVIFAASPFFGDNFILNQGIWIAPFLILSPLLKLENFTPRFAVLAALAGLVSGFLWELLNFWVSGKWEYTILPEAARLFEMPLLGYLGFIPFAFSTFAVYLFFHYFIKASPAAIFFLYLSAAVASAAFSKFIVL